MPLFWQELQIAIIKQALCERTLIGMNKDEDN
jgi:hypothetical protein